MQDAKSKLIRSILGKTKWVICVNYSAMKKEKIDILKKEFYFYDTDKDGFITKEEIALIQSQEQTLQFF